MDIHSAFLAPRIATSLRFIRRKALSNPLWQHKTSIGLRRTLSISHPRPKAAIDLLVREIQQVDIPHILPTTPTNRDRREEQDIRIRRELIGQNIPHCFVAIDRANGTPCFIQWLFTASHNQFLSSFFKGRFPRLTPEQGLLECAYTPLHYRGKGIMPATMATLAELGPHLGLSELITFVDHNNNASLKGCAKAGFLPFLTRKDTTILSAFKRRRFIPHPIETRASSHLTNNTRLKEQSL